MSLLNLFGPPSKAKFAELVIAGLRSAGDTRDIAFDEAEFRLVYGTGKAGFLNLANLYQEHCSTPRAKRKAHLRNVIRAVIQGQFELPGDFDDVKPDLRPKVWSRASIDLTALHCRVEGEEFDSGLLTPLGEHFYLGLVYDLPNAIRSIVSADLEGWDTTLYEAMEVARQNLQETEAAFAAIGQRLYASVTRDNYDASRIVLVDLIRKLKVQGDPVAMIPNRDTLLISGSDDMEGLAMMLDIAEKTLEEPRPMHPAALRLAGEEWLDWKPDKSHPLYPRFEILELKSFHGDYEAQKKLLDQLHEKEGRDQFVASFSAVQNKENGEVVSYCVWSRDVDTLLPRTHKVMFFDPEREIVAGGDWEKVQGLVGRLMTPVEDLYLPRFRVTEFPSREELKEIGNEGA